MAHKFKKGDSIVLKSYLCETYLNGEIWDYDEELGMYVILYGVDNDVGNLDWYWGYVEEDELDYFDEPVSLPQGFRETVILDEKHFADVYTKDLFYVREVTAGRMTHNERLRINLDDMESMTDPWPPSEEYAEILEKRGLSKPTNHLWYYEMMHLAYKNSERERKKRERKAAKRKKEEK